MNAPGWTLADGEALAAAHPDTFLIAPYDTRAGLRPGEYAKGLFDFLTADGTTAAERMWMVVFVNHGGDYVGRLVNRPQARPADPALRPGAEIAFAARHVIDWEDADDRSRAFLANPTAEF